MTGDNSTKRKSSITSKGTQQLPELDREWVDYFIEGYDFFSVPTDEKIIRKMWMVHRNLFLKYWSSFKPFTLFGMTYYCYPGNRCAGWWWFEAPEKERRHLGGFKIPDLGEGLFFGLKQRFPVNSQILKDPPVYETSLEYLKRLGLLADKEKKYFEEGGVYIPLHDFKFPLIKLRRLVKQSIVK